VFVVVVVVVVVVTLYSYYNDVTYAIVARQSNEALLPEDNDQSSLQVLRSLADDRRAGSACHNSLSSVRSMLRRRYPQG